MQPGKLILLIILLTTLGICAAAFLGRNGGRWSTLATVLIAAIFGSFSVASAYFGVVGISRGVISLAKHGSPLTFSLTESPFSFLALVAFLFLFAFTMFSAAIWVSKGRHRHGA
jgi:hypothetical protein